MGNLDRLIRGGIAIVAIVVAIILSIDNFNWLPLVLLVVGVIMGFTALFGTCPLYMPFNFSTRRVVVEE